MIKPALTVVLGERSYPIYIGRDLLSNLGLFKKLIRAQQVVLVSDEIVAGHYLAQLESLLGQYQLTSIVLPAGEQHKSLQQWQIILDKLCTSNQARNTTIIALGGGVVGDIAGFAAACYRRGVDYIQVPTSLLAQVDASVGGKTAINHVTAKNVIGAFWQPSAVIIDVDTLRTLPPREYISGLAEVIKYGLVADSDFFDWLKIHASDLVARDEASLQYAIRRCCEIKAKIVTEDETEQGSRAILNFGHSFGHAIETITNYQQFLHGEAVAVGMLMALRLSIMLGMLPEEAMIEVRQLLLQLDLPVKINLQLSVSDFIATMRHDKKNVPGHLRLIGLQRLGKAVILEDVDVDELRQCLSQELRQ